VRHDLQLRTASRRRGDASLASTGCGRKSALAARAAAGAAATCMRIGGLSAALSHAVSARTQKAMASVIRLRKKE
jgi:hypothetical protein